MRLKTWIAAGLILVLGTSAVLAKGYSPGVNALEGELARRLEEMDATGDLDKDGRKRRRAIADCLQRMGKTREDLKSDVGLLRDIVKKLAKRFRDDEEMAAVVSAAAAVVWLTAKRELDGLGFEIQVGTSKLTGNRRAKAEAYIEQATFYLGQAYSSAGLSVTNNETIEVGVDRQAMSTPDVTLDWTKLRSALKRMWKATKRLPKLGRWIGEPDCPGRPIGAGESAAIEYASCHGALVLAARTDCNRVSAEIDEGFPRKVRILLAVCRPGEPDITVVLEVREDPEFPGGPVDTHVADGSPFATATITVYGPRGYPDHGREMTGTVTIESIDRTTGRLSGDFDMDGDVDGADFLAFSGIFDVIYDIQP